MLVKPKKYFGQHFLKDMDIAERIANTVPGNIQNILEVGAGTGALTQFLLKLQNINLKAVEIDEESIEYLKNVFPDLVVLKEDFLRFDLMRAFDGEKLGVIGNFPYNISSQILFKVIDNRDMVPFFSGMFQKEVADRICSKHGNKTYGILSVLTQAYYDAEYLFTVSENVFLPPPKVKSGVIRLIRKENLKLDCDEKLFPSVVKTAFNQRRKVMRNSLKPFGVDLSEDIFSLRPEQIDVEQFISITNLVGERIKAKHALLK